MRVAFLTYDHPFTGRSGVSVYCRDLFGALRARRVEVGAIYVQGRTWRMRPYIERGNSHEVALFRLVNSPLDPSVSLYRPEQDVRHPAVERLVHSCLERFRPDVLHIQTLQGFPASVLTVAHNLRIRTVVTFHDFWAICPRILLVRPEGEACDGPNNGSNCVRFCVRPRPWRRRLFAFGNRLPSGVLRRAFLTVRALYLRSARASGSMWAQPTGTIPPVRPEAGGRLLAGHAHRCSGLRSALQGADRLLAVSDFAKSVIARHGVPADRIRTLTPVPALSDQIAWRPRRTPQGPVRFGFLGRAVPAKGAHVFAVAAGRIPASRAEFLLFGGTTPEAEHHLRGLAGDGRLTFRGPYARHELSRILDQVDVAVVPSVIQETVGLAVLEAQAAGVPVIGSRIGAIPEFVRDGENGLLFAPGDARDLSEKMLRIVEDPVLVERLASNIRPPKSIAQHVDDLMEIYEALAPPSPRG